MMLDEIWLVYDSSILFDADINVMLHYYYFIKERPSEGKKK
jgi:hypothetical protein